MKSLLVFLVLIPGFVGAQTLLLPQGAMWKFFDQGNVGNATWADLGFNSFSWPSGNAELGYGEGDENTVVSYGVNASNKFLTTYFRHEFNINNPQQFSHLEINMLRDDGAVVYINGVEVWRSNMPSGTITYGTSASGTIAWPNENDWQAVNVSASYLQNGPNVIAVEVHQDSPSSSDLSFNLFMIAHESNPAQIIRGPYLQQATETSMIVRWRTDLPTDSRVDFGLQGTGPTNLKVTPEFTYNHAVKITGLTPETMYAYSIGSYSHVLMESPNLFFETLPVEGDEGNYEFVILGDCGTGYQEQLDVKDAVVAARGRHYDGVILLGDNAYQSGFDSEYQNNFFAGKYNEIIENSVIWPCPGNHDYNNNLPFSPSPAYFEIFDCPTQAESGGVASNTEKYYSYNFGNVHFISLDSYDEPRSASAAMAQWLQNDLTANILPWVVAYWHHPPYTKGSHDSDNDNFLDGELVEMREEIVPILEAFDVDLVLNGHSHSYERSFLISGHTGDSDSFGPEHLKMNGSGNYPFQCPYQKSSTNGLHDGTVYCVAGNAGKISGVDSEWPHPAMSSYFVEVGALFLNVNKNRLDLTFLSDLGFEYDHVTIVKDAGGQQDVVVCINEQVTLSPSWNAGNGMTWQPGGQIDSVYTIAALSNATITATDFESCIVDTFNLIVLQNDSCGYLENEVVEFSDFGLSASYFEGTITIHQSGDEFFKEFDLYDYEGRLIQSFSTSAPFSQHLLKSPLNGVFLLKPKNLNRSIKIHCYE